MLLQICSCPPAESANLHLPVYDMLYISCNFCGRFIILIQVVLCCPRYEQFADSSRGQPSETIGIYSLPSTQREARQYMHSKCNYLEKNMASSEVSKPTSGAWIHGRIITSYKTTLPCSKHALLVWSCNVSCVVDITCQCHMDCWQKGSW